VDLKTYQEMWHKLFDFSSPTPDDPALKLYQKFVQHHYSNILRKVYSRIDHYFSDFDWKTHTALYYKDYPPGSYELNHLAERFPDYLKSNNTVPIEIAELADYEWTEFSVDLSEADETAAIKNLRHGEVVMNPTIKMIQQSHDIAAWVQANDLKEDQNNKPTQSVSVKNNLLAVVRDHRNDTVVFSNLNAIASIVIAAAGYESKTKDRLRALSLQTLAQLNLGDLPIDENVLQLEFDRTFEFLVNQKILLEPNDS